MKAFAIFIGVDYILFYETENFVEFCRKREVYKTTLNHNNLNYINILINDFDEPFEVITAIFKRNISYLTLNILRRHRFNGLSTKAVVKSL